MKSKIFGPILAVMLVFGGFAGYGTTGTADGGWFHPFRHKRCNNQVVVYPQPVIQPCVGIAISGIFKAHFGEDVDCPFHKNRCHSDHWVTGYVNGDGWIYWEKEVPDPFHPGVVTDVEQAFKDLENDIFNVFHKHHDRLVGPKRAEETK